MAHVKADVFHLEFFPSVVKISMNAAGRFPPMNATEGADFSMAFFIFSSRLAAQKGKRQREQINDVFEPQTLQILLTSLLPSFAIGNRHPGHSSTSAWRFIEALFFVLGMKARPFAGVPNVEATLRLSTNGRRGLSGPTRCGGVQGTRRCGVLCVRSSLPSSLPSFFNQLQI